MNPEHDLAHAISNLACVVRESTEAKKQGLATSQELADVFHKLTQVITKLGEDMAIKVSEIKAAVAAAAKANKEAFAELGTKIADLQKQIDDLIAGNSDPTVTDEAFEADLKALAADAQALADIVPGSPTPTP